MRTRNQLAVMLITLSLNAGTILPAFARTERLGRTPYSVNAPGAPAPFNASKAIGNSHQRRDSGALLWEDRYDASDSEQAFAAATLGNHVFAAGYVSTPTGRDFVVRAYDANNGTLVWQDQFDRGGSDFASGVVTDGKNRIFVSGTVFRLGTNEDWVLRAYDAETGRLLWEDLFDLEGRADFCRGTALTFGDGLVFLGGYGTNRRDVGDLNSDYVVRAYDAESGSFVWEDRIVGYSGAHALAFENGRLFAGGWKYRPNREYAIVRAYNGRSGDLLWERSTPGAVGFRQTFTSTIKAQGGRVFAAQPRRTIQPPFALIPLIVTYDGQSGTPLWQDQFTPEGYLRDLDVFGNRLFAVGEGGPHCSTSSDSNCDEVIRGYDATSGQLLWTRRLDLSGTEDYAALITATSGKVFVLAQANSTAVIPDCCAVGQWVLQAFNDAGQLLWQTVEGELESGVYNMALDRGRLFIPGRAVSAETGQWDFLVRAYDVRGRRSDIEPVFFVPGNLRLAGAAGKVSYQVTSDSPFIADAHGLIPAEETSGTVIDDPANDIGAALATGVGITVHPVSVPAGTRLFRAALSSWATDGADDLNLYAFDSRGRLVASSQNVSTDELLDISLPGPGKYYVVVHGFQTDGPDANYTLFTWLLGERAEGNLTVTQPVPDTGAEWTVSLSWSGLIDDRRYLGAVTYTVGGIEKRQTLIAVDP